MPYPDELATHLLGVGGVVVHNHRILLVKLGYGKASNFWLIPGGLVEKGETLEEALRREIKEETNLVVEPAGIIGIRSMVRRDEITDVYTIFSCNLVSDPDQITPQENEVSEASWIDFDQLNQMEDVPAYTKKILNVHLDHIMMSRDRSFDKMAKERIGVEKYEQYWI